MTIAAEIQTFFRTGRSFRDIVGDDLSAQTPLLDRGILDSVGIFELIGFLEERFRIRVESQDIVEKNFRDIQAIEQFVKAKGEAVR